MLSVFDFLFSSKEIKIKVRDKVFNPFKNYQVEIIMTHTNIKSILSCRFIFILFVDCSCYNVFLTDFPTKLADWHAAGRLESR